MSDFEAVASVVQRLAVLTAAGIPAASAWRQVRVDGVDPAAVAAPDLPELIAGVAASAPHDERSAWSVLAAIWGIATETGAALAPALERTAGVLRDLAQSGREVETALAGPVATSRIVLALPLIGLLLGALLGFDVLGALATPPGLGCLCAGVALIVAAVRWNRRLLRWARARDATPGIGFELLAIALSGGSSVERALTSVASASARAGLAPPGDEVGEVLDFASRAGVPVIPLLRAEADERRRSARADDARRAAQLESRLLLPLGLCVLPAFVLVGVAPLGLAILSSTAVAF